MSAKQIDDGGTMENVQVAGQEGEYLYTIPGETRRQALARCAMQGFCANPAVFAADPRCGWIICNATDSQLTAYCFKLADEQIAFERAEMDGAK